MVYDARLDGMAITMIRPDGTRYASTCHKDSPLEDVAIILKGIGKGCSLEVVE